jgi:hypothetical protein
MKDARLELLLKTLKLGHIPAGMELFKPGEAKNIDVIEQEIAGSDLYVVFVGARAGSQVPGEEPLTYTMKEFSLAQRYRLPIIPFLLNEQEYGIQRDKLTNSDANERAQEIKLKKFREEIQLREDGSKRLAGFFSYENISKLCDDYGDAIRNEVESLESRVTPGGWVSGQYFDQLKTRITLDESVSSNPFFHRFADRLSAFKILTKRVLIQPEAKEAIARHFCRQFMPRLDKYGISYLYFESGSSIAYVSGEFIKYVKEEEWFREHGMHSRLKLRTNNLLTYLDFLMVEPPWLPIEIQLMPHGSISHDYGATYGSLKSARDETAISRARPGLPLPEDAKQEIGKMQRKLEGFTKQKGLALMTTSGVDITANSMFPGPHVGSYHNMLLKRCLFSLSCSKILFLDERKWGYPFEQGNCFSVCDGELSWERLKRETPLAIAMAIRERGRRQNIANSLSEHGFEFQEWGNEKSHEASPLPVIAGNEPFAERFGMKMA